MSVIIPIKKIINFLTIIVFLLFKLFAVDFNTLEKTANNNYSSNKTGTSQKQLFKIERDFAINHLNILNSNINTYIPNITDSFINLKSIYHHVPFTPQAPFGNWKDKRLASACEEASALMAMKWVENKMINKQEALSKILDMSNFQKKKYGSYYDTSAADTKKRIFNDYFNYYNVTVKNIYNASSIIYELNKNNIVIVPANGRKLDNPYFTPPGPKRHMMVITGWNETAQTFITNDPGTKRGENFIYKKNNLISAIRDYQTGYKIPIDRINKVMIVIKKSKFRK